ARALSSATSSADGWRGLVRPLQGLGGLLVLGLSQHPVHNQPGILADRLLDLRSDLRVFLEERLCILAPLADALAVEREPGARLLDDPRLHAEVDDLASSGNSLTVHDVELDLLEGRRDLVLDHFHAGLVTHDLVAILDLTDAANIEPHGRGELERVLSRRRFRSAEHHADPHADLVDEDHHAA